MDPFETERPTGAAAGHYRKLLTERIIWNTADPAALETLRRDVERIAADMEDPERPPPMFWSGIPWPEPGLEPTCDYHLVVSVGGTKTDFLLLRLEGGRPIGLDLLGGREVEDPEGIDRAKAATQMATPKHGPAMKSGLAMVAAMVDHLAGHLGKHRAALERCEAILLSWGFAHRVLRTGPRLAGGLSARVTKMTKDQAGFTPELAGKDIGALFERELRARLGWSRPVAVANDTVMALHWFLSPERRRGHARVGLFINGTGTNFSAAERYAVRPEGIISSGEEDYVPERITARRPARAGERVELFFVNYETGSIELEATRTRFDDDPEYPIERNVLAGGNAFPKQLRALVETFISPEAYRKVLDAHRAARSGEESHPGARAVSTMAADGEASPEMRLIARAIIARSALHAALVLAAVTRRTGFGQGEGGLPDLLGMEGSVWKIPGYKGLVEGYWQELAGKVPLRVHLEAEPTFNASLSGPLYLAALHRGGDR